MAYSLPQMDPAFIATLTSQTDPRMVEGTLVLYTIGMLQGVSSVLREHAMRLLLEGCGQSYVDGWLDAADTLDLEPPPREKTV